MVDASDIVDAIKAVRFDGIALEQAIATYESEMKPRGVKEVGLSLEQALKARDISTLKESPVFKIGWQRGAAETTDLTPVPASARAMF
ncbi:hypothetical protein NHQ30_003515 [Ciborinia camelliae]|nr:hypothetical protein NHQ30_003515 [Ciborinia camelliae]